MASQRVNAPEGADVPKVDNLIGFIASCSEDGGAHVSFVISVHGPNTLNDSMVSLLA